MQQVMFPVTFLRKMGIYNLNFNGVSMKVKVVDHPDPMEIALNELKSRLGSLPLVGFDLKKESDSNYPQLLLLYIKDFCLIIQTRGGFYGIMTSLASFLSDGTICFLSTDVEQKRRILLEKSQRCLPWESRANLLATGVDVGTFAARVLKDRALEGCGSLVYLAGKVGLKIKEQKDEDKEKLQCPDWGAPCFSDEEVKYAMHEAYMYYTIGERLISML